MIIQEQDIDKIAKNIIDTMVDKGFFLENLYNYQQFEKLHLILKEKFFIPQTSITNIMARILFGISSSFESNIIVGAGTYTGNALSWLAGEQILNPNTQKSIYGLDISKEATIIAQENFKKVNSQGVFLLQEDAIEWLQNTNLNIDLLFIDIDTKTDGKKKYLDLLEVAYPKITNGGLIIAHDINEKKFISDLEPFNQALQNKKRFSKSINLNIDAYGISVSIKGEKNEHI